MSHKLRRIAKIALVLPITLGTAWLVKQKQLGRQQRRDVNMTVTHVDVQNCIDRCTQTAQQIRTIANGIVDHRARHALAEADRHIEMCIHSCLDAKHISKP